MLRRPKQILAETLTWTDLLWLIFVISVPLQLPGETNQATQIISSTVPDQKDLDSETQFRIELKSLFFTDESSGAIIEKGLIVCDSSKGG